MSIWFIYINNNIGISLMTITFIIMIKLKYITLLMLTYVLTYIKKYLNSFDWNNRNFIWKGSVLSCPGLEKRLNRGV